MTKETIKHLSDVMKAYSEGETIQYLSRGQWFDFLEEELTIVHLSSFEFRIKPEDPKLRPYKNEKEFLQAMKDHGPYITQNNINYYCYQRVTNTYVQFAQGEDKPLTFKSMLENKYKWQDGTPCGILETNKIKSSELNIECNKNTNNHEYVDLGLPSGTLWATCNVGAENPWEYGKYFAWGETDGYYDNEKHNFSWNTYKWCDGRYNALTKYNNKYGSYGKNTDNKLVLDPEDDAAHVHMGGDWRMPTQDEMQELIDNTNYEWVENYQGTGVNGNLFTSRKDSSKSMFIPASGYRWDSTVRYQDSRTFLWCSTLYTDYPYGAWNLYFNSVGYDIKEYIRYYGFCVRGVL